MEASKEVEMMKDGARRVQQYLAGQGVELKHALLLEALSAGFGARNWRTVRDKLNKPGTPAVTLEDLNGFRWEIDAVYSEDGQPYSDYVKGDNAFDAQVKVQVEVMFDSVGGAIDICSVVDRLTNKICGGKGTACNAKILPHGEMLVELAQIARRKLGEPPKRGIHECEAWDQSNLAIELIEELLGTPGSTTGLAAEIDFLEEGYASMAEYQTFDYTDLRGVEHTDIRIADAVQTVLDIVIGKADIATLPHVEKLHAYHAKELLERAAEALNYVFSYEP